MGSLRILGALAAALAAPAWGAPAATYRNPLPMTLANGEPAQNCADPAVLRDPRAKTPTWYLYCTSDPVKLVEMAHGGLHRVELAKELAPVPADFPRYGNTVVGTPDTRTWLRLDVHRVGGDERYTAYSSRGGKTWVGGGTWTHRLGPQARLGLVAMGGARCSKG